MSEPAGTYRSPYTPTPGSSTPGPEVTPEEGGGEMWTFFWVSVASVAIITVVGLASWFYVHP